MGDPTFPIMQLVSIFHQAVFKTRALGTTEMKTIILNKLNEHTEMRKNTGEKCVGGWAVAQTHTGGYFIQAFG